LKVRLGIVTGLAAEQNCLRALPVADWPRVRCFGMGPEAAGKAASELLGQGCAALLSFGLAGGLDPLLRPGSVVIADAIVTERGELFSTDRAWRWTWRVKRSHGRHSGLGCRSSPYGPSLIHPNAASQRGLPRQSTARGAHASAWSLPVCLLTPGTCGGCSGSPATSAPRSPH
jgi:hypothetical protein